MQLRKWMHAYISGRERTNHVFHQIEYTRQIYHHILLLLKKNEFQLVWTLFATSSGGELIYFRHVRQINITIINYKHLGKSQNVQIISHTMRLCHSAGHIKHQTEESAEDGQRRSLQIARIVIERYRVKRKTQLYRLSTRPESNWKRWNGWRQDFNRIVAYQQLLLGEEDTQSRASIKG